MNAVNPFQIPPCFQVSLQQRRRERFKKSVIAIIAGTTVLLAVLLILGCNSEHAKAASAMTVGGGMAGSLATSETEHAIVSPPAPASKSSVPSPIVALAATPIVSKAGASETVSRPAAIYVVKPSDTLSRIAKFHGTTVTALKAANGLDTDRIAIGMKLKLPEA